MKKTVFDHDWYQAHSKARQNHLASIELPLDGREVLEIGAGVGNHTQFFLDRGCKVTVTDARPENIEVVRERFHGLRTCVLDVEQPGDFHEVFDVVYCYGLLYHLADPVASLGVISKWVGDLLLLETCLSTTNVDQVKSERPDWPGASPRGTGLYPTKESILAALKSLFPFVYRPVGSPVGLAFDMPIDWVDPRGEIRAVFIASRTPVENKRLCPQ